MDSRTEHPPAEGHEDEHSHEKTSVFKKVKAKAKRMKDTLKKHGQGPDQDHHEHHPDEHHIPDDHDLGKEDDEDEEMVEDPEVHARTETENSGKSKLDFGRLGATREDAPSPGERHESKIIKPIKGIEPNTDQPISKFGNPIVSGEQSHAPQNTPVSPPPGDYGTKATDPTKTSVLGEGGGTGQPKVNLERPMGLEEDRHAPKDRSEPHSPTNYRTKVTDPKGTGGEEAGIAPILQSFEKMKVHDEPSPKPTGPDDNSPTTIRQQFTKSPTESHDQFSPGPIPPEAKTVRDKSQLPESFDATKRTDDSWDISEEPKPTGPDDNSPTTITKLPDDSRDISEEPMNQRSSTEKIPPATSTIADKAISAKNVVASKSGYGEPKPKPTGPDDNSPTTITKLTDDSRNISEEPRSSTEKISPATSTIADKAISAKNAVASKFGYGEKDMTSGTEVRQSGDNAKSSPAEYGKKIAATETEKQNPVYEKVAEAGSTAISKVHGTGTTDTDPGIGNESRSSDVRGQDKGVSVKDYFLEKSRPGDEDRALAEVISDTLHKPNKKPGEGEMPPMGKVTESGEVARQLGTKEDNSCQGMQSSDVNNSQEKGVVDKFKGAVGSWFGLGGESQPQVSPQPHDGSSYGDEGISRSANGDGGNSSPTADEGKRLQEN
ncbi:low-temperature-induced 65 kDa protein [Juglans microcarpa x Juglans regia]|uniref:low-temperature-induced 65 kDa protein n=1 Tax=Juglans microcarpa x Juglans regia TaxID=2249226 RepID=UPI001B7EECD0|nr:low-temperature-induced 65 kDa protein [Juglans microcarpa x Juglans regia]